MAICLRYLTSRLLEQDEVIPVFLELRKCGEDNLWSLVIGSFSRIHINNEDRIDKILHSGRVVLLLDGFDEVPIEKRESTYREISEVTEQHPKLKVVVTSRPGVFAAPLRASFSICPLRSEDVSSVVACYATPSECEAIVQRTGAGVGRKMANVLTTPLMVLMLVIHFRYTNSIPEGTIAFYKDLLDVLLRRHNISEVGLKRRLVSELDTFQLRLYFCALCFVVRNEFDGDDLLIADMEDASLRALRLARIGCDNRSALDDIVQVTNLLIEEGGRYRFVHKSVCEFYAASFVASLPEMIGRKFYAKCIKTWGRWGGELDFLEHVDTYRFLEYFAIPDVVKVKPLTEKGILSQFKVLVLHRYAKGVKAELRDSPRRCLDVVGKGVSETCELRLTDCVASNQYAEASEILRRGPTCTIHRKRSAHQSEEAGALNSRELNGWDESKLLRTLKDHLRQYRVELVSNLDSLRSRVAAYKELELDFLDD